MNVLKHQLPNKLRLINVYDQNSSSVSIMVLVSVGSRHEEAESSGIAHFVEHNFFKGTEKLPTSRHIGMAIENLGGSSNAFTSYEYTGYYIKVPKEKFEAAMDIMADMIKNSTFPKLEVEKERGVVIEEIKMYEDIPMRKVSNLFSEDLFGSGHPLGRDIAGTINTVSNLERKDIVNFTNKNYTGENVLIAIAGGEDKKKVKSKVEELYSDLPAGKKHSYEIFKRQPLIPSINIHKRPTEQTHIVLGGFGHQRSFKNRYAVMVGNAILGSGFGSLLFQKIREELSLAYYISSHHYSLHDVGTWNVSMGVDNERIIQAIEGVLTVLKDFSKGKFSAEDLKRAKNFIIGNLVTDLESSDDLAQWHGSQELLMGEMLTIEETKQRIRDVDKDNVVEFWTQILQSDNLILSAISPLEDTDEVERVIENAFN